MSKSNATSILLFFLLQFLILFLYVCNKFTYTTSLRRPILKTQTSSHQLGQESIFNNILYPNIYDDYNIKTIIMVKWVCYLTHTSSQKVRRTGRNWMGLETRSQMTNHCKGHASHLKTASSLSPSVCLSLSLPLAVFCHNPAYVTAWRCTWSFHLKKLSEWKALTVRGRLFHRKAPEKAILTCFKLYTNVYPWPNLGKLSWQFLKLEKHQGGCVCTG